MEEQVYQKETILSQDSLQFYDPETKRVRGYLAEKANSDEHNRLFNSNSNCSIACSQVSTINSSSLYNSYINGSSSNFNKISNCSDLLTDSCKSLYGVSENEYNFGQGQSQNNLPAKPAEEQQKKFGILLDLVQGQCQYGDKTQGLNTTKRQENELNLHASQSVKEGLYEEPMILESTTSLNLNGCGSPMSEEVFTPTDHQTSQQLKSQYYSSFTPALEEQYSSSSTNNQQSNITSQQSGLSVINNENICQLEMKLSQSASKQRSSGKKYNDRFIPNRVSANLYNLINPTQQSSVSAQGGNGNVQSSSDDQEEGSARRQSDNPRNEQNSKLYSNLLQSSILGESPELLQSSRSCGSSNPAYILKDSTIINYGQSNAFPSQRQKKLLTYSTKHQMQNYENELKIAAHNSIVLSHEQNIRKIPKQPYKILESRNLQDDFYLNLLDWSPLNYLAVGLKNQVAIWSGCNSTISRLCGLGDVGVSSVSCSQRSNHIAVGDSIGNILIYDIQHKEQPLLKIEGHSDRIGSIAWNGSLIASGSKDKNILVRDLRAPQKYIQKYSGHKQEICGLKWSFDENILASGGNDNKLFLWTLKSRDELAKFSQHTAAVKALGFSPHQHNILASGGGTADRCIRFWNTSTLQQIDCLDTGSQVCNLMFSKNVNEIVSTHGYSLNQIIVWKYPSMKKIQTLTGHTQRVLYLAMSPCGQNVVTGAGDETLRFWNIFPSMKNKSNILGSSSLFPSCIDLR